MWLVVEDAFEEEVLIRRVKWRGAVKHLKYEAAETPSVDAFAVLLAENDFGCHVLRRPAHRHVHSEVRVAEVHQFRIPLSVDHDVLRLNVPIGHVQRMQILHR